MSIKEARKRKKWRLRQLSPLPRSIAQGIECQLRRSRRGKDGD